MTALQLYKFISENGIEYHQHEGDIILFVPNYHIEAWHKLLGAHIFDDEGIECRMKDGYFCFLMNDICEYNGFELKDIFTNYLIIG